MLSSAIDLARIQFAANISFHILFPTITIALAWMLLYFKLRFHWSGDAGWKSAYGFWVKVFALTFALGVVSGITMSFQFGTNWPGFMETVGNVAGPLLAYEVLTAFFLEATFLGIMLFGASRVSERLHTVSTLMVAVGTSLSAYWILALNTWMQHPMGFEMIDGQAHVTDWKAILFNQSLSFRLLHMLLASGLTAAFLVAGLSAWRRLRGHGDSSVVLGLRSGVFLAALLIPLQVLVGDLHGLDTLERQPAKIAAIEANWETGTRRPLYLFAVPDAETRSNRFPIAIPGGASLVLTHDVDGELRGLNEFGEDHPPVAPVFFAFRVMVGVGLLMWLLSWISAWRLICGSVLAPWMSWSLVAMTFSGWVATLAGWYVTEIGRQPWLVTGVLRTANAASDVTSASLVLTLALYLSLYVLLLLAYITTLFYLAEKQGRHAEPDPGELNPASPGGTA